jgi:hypothetical protein
MISIIAFNIATQEKTDHSNIPFNAEIFGISRAREVYLEQLHDRSTGIMWPSDANELEPNKFNARFRAWVAPLPPAEVLSVFLPTALEPTTKNFVANFLLDFKALARASSWAEVWALEWDDWQPRPHFPEVFFGARAIPAAVDFCFARQAQGGAGF